MAHEIHTYLHCRRCLLGQQTERLEVGFTPAGMMIQCPKHGKVGHFTSEDLEAHVALGAHCDCCDEGVHRS